MITDICEEYTASIFIFKPFKSEYGGNISQRYFVCVWHDALTQKTVRQNDIVKNIAVCIWGVQGGDFEE
jgi:hypothetical protein